MSRMMSVAFTEQAVIERRKTVTRRKGWWRDKNGRPIVKAGDRLKLVRKAMGLRKGEKVHVVAEVEVVDVRREPLFTVGQPGELLREGFPDMAPATFMAKYFAPQGLLPSDYVTRIEWRYLEEAST